MGRLTVWVLMGLALLAVSLHEVQVSAEAGPTESECRPYIEKAINELKTVETDGDGSAEDDDKADDTSIEDTGGATAEVASDETHEDDDHSKEDDADTAEATDESAEADASHEDTAEQHDHKSDEDSEDKSGEDTTATEEEHDDDNDDDDKKSAEDDDKSGEDHDDEKSEESSDDQKSGEETNDAKSEEDDGKSGEDDNKSDEVEEAETKSDEDDDKTAEEEDTKSDEGESKSDEAHDDHSDEVETAETDEKDSHEDAADDTAEDDSSETKDDGDDEDDKSKEDDGKDHESEEQSTGEDASSEHDDSEDKESHEAEGEEVEEEVIKREKRSLNEASHEDTQEDDSKEEEATKEDEHSAEDDDTKEESDDKDSKETTEDKEVEESEEDKKPDDDDDDSKEDKKADDDDSKEDADDADKKSSAEDDTAESSEDKKDAESAEGDDEESAETKPEDDLLMEFEIPENLRNRGHIDELLHLDVDFEPKEAAADNVAEVILRDLKRIYESAIKPLETLYKYRDLSNRHFGDPEIFSKPLVLFMGPWSGGKSSIINYLTNNEYTLNSLRTGAEPSPAYFNILMHGEEPEVLDGTQLAADWTFSGLQKFGQGLEDRLRGLKLPNKLLEKVNIVEIPGILEVRKQVSRLFPFNDACQWFIDRADIIFLVYDPAKLDVGPETEAILDQLKGREYQTRIVLNKADLVKPEELLRVQSALIWNISPLMSSAQPPVMYTTSLWSHPYDTNSPIRLLQAQERAFLRDLRTAIDKRIDNKIASARRFAVRVRNHAKMVDCYLTTYYNHKTLFGNKKRIADQIIDHPQNYHIYEGLSTLTNISRYDLPDPEVYRDFFRLNPLYEFQKLQETCTYFRGCPINKLDVAIAYDLPELVGKYKKMAETALTSLDSKQDSTKGKS